VWALGCEMEGEREGAFGRRFLRWWRSSIVYTIQFVGWDSIVAMDGYDVTS